VNAKDEAIHGVPQHEGLAARWNTVRYDAEKSAAGGHVESYFLKLNDPEGRRALWLKATILARTSKSHGGASASAESWAIAFDREGRHVAVKDTTPLAAGALTSQASARFGPSGLDANVCNLQLSPGRAVGSVGEGKDRISFDLRFTMGAPPLIPFPSERMYETALPSSKLVSPHPDSCFTGTYTAGGQTVEVNGWHGMQGHNWGTRHAQLYAWCHVNQWDNHEDLVLEGVTARVLAGPILAPPLTVLCVRARGVRYDFNGPLTLLRARGHIDGLRKWRFRAQNGLAQISGELFAETSDFVGLTYENPDGKITYCLNSKIARGRMRLSVKGKPDLDVITRAAALEIGTKDARHGVTMLA
jgi:hypothetical protein